MKTNPIHTPPAGRVPAAFLIDEQFLVRGCYGEAGPYLRTPAGTGCKPFFKMIADELVFELSEMIKRADRDGKEVKKDRIEIGGQGRNRTVSAEVTSLRSLGRNWHLIVIHDECQVGIREQQTVTAYMVSAPPTQTVTPCDRNPRRMVKDLRIKELEKMLHETRGLLMAANQQAAESYRTLQRSLEEISAAALKLQARNRELEALVFEDGTRMKNESLCS